MTDPADRLATLRSVAPDYARVALANIHREYPNHQALGVSEPGQYREPHERHPAFYGSFDWHSCVEMHWVLVRLLRTVPDAVDGERIRAALRHHLNTAALQTETSYARDNPAFERPYGWAWLLHLAADLAAWDDPDGRRWAAAVAPLAEQFAAGFVRWLPALTYPVRYGVHANTAFALGRSLGFARQRAGGGGSASELLPALTAVADRFFGADTDYPAAWEPSGGDFLSPALVEAELMTRLLPADRFGDWLASFLPELASAQPSSIFAPATVADATDGQGAHLVGLNLSRAWCWRRLADALPDDDPRIPVLTATAERHAAGAMGQVVGSHYMVEHWLAAYALLFLTDDDAIDRDVPAIASR